jgi:hypothetical protein
MAPAVVRLYGWVFQCGGMIAAALRSRRSATSEKGRGLYATRDAEREDMFAYIEMFYNLKRKDMNDGLLSTIDFERRRQKINEAGILETRGTSYSQWSCSKAQSW